MNRNRVSVILAALLQILPLSRVAIINPATTTSTFAIILRWTIGATATVGAFDSVSGASTVLFINPTNCVGYVGVPLYFKMPLTNVGSDCCTTVAVAPYLPPGLSNYTVDNYQQKDVYGVISGTPTAPTNMMLFLGATHTAFPITTTTNLYLTILNGTPPKPTITNQPAPQSVTAGGNVTFSVLAGGYAPLRYQWRSNNVNILNATNTSLTISRARQWQAGNYLVVITNVSGGITSSPALLTVNLPNSPQISPPGVVGTNFVFTFTPVVGLTNIVQTNSAIGTAWATRTNIAPPTAATPVSITNPISDAAKFFRVRIDP
jgi:hypothetical protein